MSNNVDYKSFKNVGVLKTFEPNVLQKNRSPIPIGVKTPLELDTSSNNLFKMHYNLKEQIADDLRNLILTNHGERLGLYSFGANLRPLLSEFSSKENFEAEAMLRINTAVSRWMPYIALEEFGSNPKTHENYFTGSIDIVVVYSIPKIKVSNQQLEITLFVM